MQTDRLIRHLLLPVIAAAALGQTQTSRITGVVTDPTGARVAGVEVETRHLDTNTRRAVRTNEDGLYVVPGIQPGRYEISTVHPGFMKAVASPVIVNVNQTATVDFVLQIGSVENRVNVSADTALIDSATAQMSTVITEEKITELPLNGRNFSQLLLLAPGAAPVSVAQNSSGGQVQRVGAFVFPAMNGQTNRSNSFLLDGVYNNAPYSGTYAIALNIDALDHFKVQSHSDQAEFGGATGGIVNTVSKSGTNAFHGSAYWFLRNDALDARGFFTARKPTLRQNQFGATAGGPILKDRTFFFASYEGYRQRNPSAVLYVVPTPAELAGDFSASRRGIFNPFSTRPDPADPRQFIRDPFPGNRIPASMISRTTRTWAEAIIPAPIDTGNPAFNGRNSTPQSFPMNQYNIRGDHNFSERRSVWGRFSWGQQDETRAQTLQGTTTKVARPVRSLGIGYTGILDPNTLTSGLFGWTSLGEDTVSLLTGQNLFSSGIFGNVPVNPAVNAPAMSLPSAFGTSSNIVTRTQAALQFGGSITMQRGKHTIKAGVETLHRSWNPFGANFALAFNSLQTSDPRNPGATGSDIASFVLGVMDSWELTDRVVEHRSSIWNGYVQDTWKVNSRVTVNLGLRYDLLVTPTYTDNFPSTWDFNTGKFLVGIDKPPKCGPTQPAPCLPDPGQTYIRDHVEFRGRGRLRPIDWKMYGPRLGVAWRAHDRTVVRSSFGVFYDVETGNTQQFQNVAGGWPGTNLLRGLNLNRTTADFTAGNPFGGAELRVPAATPATAAAYMWDPNFRQPYSMQWNFEIQRAIGTGSTVSIGYVGSRSLRLAVGGSYNTAVAPGPGPIPARQPFPHAPVTNYDRSIGQSSYHGLQIKAERRLANGLSGLLSYTWSKSIDLASSGQFGVEGFSLQNAYDVNGSRSVSGFDLPHVFSATAVYQLPTGRGRRWLRQGLIGRIAGEWQLNTIVLLRSGQPYTPLTNIDVANVGAISAESRARPNLVGNPHMDNPTPAAWFNKAAYAAPPAFTFGSAGRNQLRSDNFQGVDLSLFREDALSERVRMQLRAEAFNVFNHPVFGIPQTVITHPNFGRVSDTVSNARQIQLGLRVLF